MKKIVIIELIVLLVLSFVLITLIDNKRVNEIHLTTPIDEKPYIPATKKSSQNNDSNLENKTQQNTTNPQKQERYINKGIAQEVYGFVFLNNKKIKVNDEIKEGDIIKTSPYSYIIIKFSNDSIFRINPKSEVIIKTPNLEKESFSIELASGAILSHFKKKGKYNLYTKTSVIGVRGTTFFTYVDPKEETKTNLCACHGEINFNSENDSFKKEITSEHHEGYILSPDGYITDEKTLKSLTPIMVQNHDDERIDYLKKILDENLPIVENPEPDYHLSENHEILVEALKLIENKKGVKAMGKLDSISRVDPYAMYLIGRILNEGIGIKKDVQTAAKWFKKAADLEFPSAIQLLEKQK
ncbi:FecR domain-containing protein [bacterium]|nr:FecR domain-containing protein [bacterium]